MDCIVELPLIDVTVFIVIFPGMSVNETCLMNNIKDEF